MKALSQRSGNQLSLIVPAFSTSFRVERNRDDDIRMPFLGGRRDKFRETRCKPVSQTYYFLVFQQKNCFGKGFVVGSKASSVLESVEIHAAKPAEWLRACNATAESNGRPQQTQSGSEIRSNPARQLSQIGMRLAFVRASAQMRHGPGKQYRCKCAERVLKNHGYVGAR